MQAASTMFHRPMTHLLRPGRPTRLIWLALGSVPLAEIAAHAQPDIVVLDLQHGLWERTTMEAAIGLVNARVPVLVRTADGSLPAIAMALDAGAAGVLVPMVETADDARRIVDASRYPPVGRRSAGGVRPLMLGLSAMVEADKHIALGALIETVQGVANARDICAVEGLDFIFIGTGDLAISRGTGDPAGLADCCAHVRTEAHARGLPCGLFTGSLEAARKGLADGYDMVVVANDIDLAVRCFADAVQGSHGGTPR